MSPLLQKIINECPEHLRNLLEESATDIDADFATVIECAGDDDLKPKLVLSFAITINLDEHGVNNKLSWSVKKKAESCFKIDDPDQEEFPSVKGLVGKFVKQMKKTVGPGGSVTLSSSAGTTTIDG